MRAWLEDMERRHGLETLARQARRLVLASFILLLGLMAYRGWLIQGEGSIDWRPLIAFLLPLVLFLPSILARRPRGHAWLAFVSLLYFMQGVMVATLPDQQLRGVLEACVALGLFTGCMGYARFQSRLLRQRTNG